MNYTLVFDINHIWQPAALDKSLGPIVLRHYLSIVLPFSYKYLII